MQLKPHLLALRVSLIYCLTASAWILLSDKILAWFVSDPAQLSRLQTYKGWAFVFITGLLLYWVLTQWSQEWTVAVAREKSPPANTAPDDVERQLRRTINAGTLMALLVLGFIGYTAWQEARRATANAQWALQTHEALLTLSDVLGYVVDMESGTRVYVISQNPDLLEAHHRALTGIDGKLKQLRRLTADNPAEQLQLDTLERQVVAKLDFLQRVVTACAVESPAAAARLVESDQGQVLMDQVRATGKAIREAEEQLLRAREAAFTSSDQQAVSVTLLGALAGGILMTLAWVTLRREISAEGRARAEVRKLNVELEQRVTERTAQLSQVNESLRTSEERYHSTLDNILESCQLIGFDWRYLYLNDAAAIQNRRPNAELLGRKMTEVWPGLEVTGIFALFRDCLTERTPFHEEIEFEFPDGSKGWFDVRAQPVPEGIFILSIDISERRRAEAAIRRERDFSNAVLTSLPGVVYCYNEQFQFRRWNKNFEQVTGYAGQEIARMSPLDFFGDTERELVRVRIQEVFSQGAAEVEANLVTKDGRRLPYFLNGMTAEISGERCLIGVGIEIAERQRAEQKLLESREQLRALLSRLQRAQEEERTRVAREIHDELGQLLTGLKMDLRWLERKLAAPGLPPAMNPLLDRAVAASELADTTIAAVQKIAAELRPGALDKLGLTAALVQMARRFQERSGIHCAVVVAESEDQLSPDVATELFYICQEALTNVARHAQAKNVEIRLRTEAAGTVLEVCDDGSGIAEADLNASRSLGLLGMKERVGHCQGTIVFQRGDSGGTRITVRVPRLLAPVREEVVYDENIAGG